MHNFLLFSHDRRLARDNKPGGILGRRCYGQLRKDEGLFDVVVAGQRIAEAKALDIVGWRGWRVFGRLWRRRILFAIACRSSCGSLPFGRRGGFPPSFCATGKMRATARAWCHKERLICCISGNDEEQLGHAHSDPCHNAPWN